MKELKKFFKNPFHRETKEEKIWHLLLRNWHIIALILIFITAFSVRYYPAQYKELPGLDEYYIYRMGEYMLANNLQLPELDTLRYHPDGLPSRQFEFPGPFLIPVIMYLVMFAPFGLSFFQFSFLYPPLMGALAVVVMYFVGKEFFNDKKAGLFSAFFLAVIPGFISRTVAALIEKEAAGAPFMLLSVYFFIKAYKNNSWKHGIIGGVSLGILAVTWGGSDYMRLFLALATFILLLINKYSDGLLKSYTPAFILSVLFPLMTLRSIDVTQTTVIVPAGVLLLLLLRFALVRYNIIKKEQAPYLVPGMVVLAVIGLLIGATQSRFLWGKIESVFQTATLSKGVIGTTVAENAPGSWNDIMSMFGTNFSAGIFPQLGFLTTYFSVWLFMLIGACFIGYEIYKTKDFIYLIPLIWLITTVWATFGFIRLMFLLGPAAALCAGFFISELIRYSSKIKSRDIIKNEKLGIRIDIISLVLGIFIIILLLLNTATAYVYTNSMGSSYNQYFDEAMTFLKEKTPEDASVLSWWDFGYWFQTKGHRASIADGGNVGDAEGRYGARNYKIADWFVDNANNWTGHYWFMERYDVDYILMDYTLPAKYGAISKIASEGSQIIGIMQFGNAGSYQKDNTTIYQFSAAPYELWVPFDSSGNIAGRPVFLVQQGGQYLQRLYVNDLCTTQGIISIGNVTSDTIPGCISLTQFGVFYIPPEAEYSIFTSLMFMDGYGLEGLTKVFDNAAIRIYKLKLPQ
ncbi:MAG: glycosyltransferase family 39 protein [Candidatus Aenigmarchaeota archaeon]|nr:glycosyltransferase family 39 protein [Candidatus Aenigmarchaeota archaeon]